MRFMCYYMNNQSYVIYFFFFNDTATTEIYTLSLHDALPISLDREIKRVKEKKVLKEEINRAIKQARALFAYGSENITDRKSTRLNSSHSQISYAVFCLKKKKKHKKKKI